MAKNVKIGDNFFIPNFEGWCDRKQYKIIAVNMKLRVFAYDFTDILEWNLEHASVPFPKVKWNKDNKIWEYIQIDEVLVLKTKTELKLLGWRF